MYIHSNIPYCASTVQVQCTIHCAMKCTSAMQCAVKFPYVCVLPCVCVCVGVCEGVGPEPWLWSDEDSTALSGVPGRQLHPLLQALA